MQVLTIQLGKKTYTSTRLTAYLSKEAMRINRDALKLAEMAKKLQQNPNDLDTASEVMNTSIDISDRKSTLICMVYGNKFDEKELEKELTQSEIDIEMNEIVLGVSGIIEKN